ncbi:MAG: polysaccharide lyase [Candidatus Yanofskybacteria bacterium]|nr:polysaccharide lyase [Candidatus Yanofskybacteria bacterium]
MGRLTLKKLILGVAALGVFVVVFVRPPIIKNTLKRIRGDAPRVTTSTPRASTGPQGTGLLFYEDFELGKIGPGWTEIGIHPKTTPPENSDSIDIVTTPVRKGNYALKIIVHPEDGVYPGDRRADKERAELVRQKFEATEGRELWYAWSIFLPVGYEYIYEKGGFHIMGQWHDQPDPGEEPTGYSPPIRVDYRPDLGSLSLLYGRIQVFDDPQQTVNIPITLGTWTDLMFHIKFSQGNDGFVEVYKNGVQVGKRITGPNMFNAEPNYLRIGLYRGPKRGGTGQPQTNILYYDEIKTGTTRESVFLQ